ncbi:pimeloyl-ACP methyl ester carboxylesterase [Nocardioides albertanoniae]|uniref:Pimeloyl-ACP methyl ester carboxylesterase n=1 Tax=Nocardioides albertanoniae TaxID=1175486 RepID=A0A543ACF2_9ACTN|nr:alpha/beta hydrolase [Nocardioides albertanoniae]TQL70247.1 pimeloyl-ACP methyl ester carboxylesterase [Nocardioides albertanoniae]
MSIAGRVGQITAGTLGAAAVAGAARGAVVVKRRRRAIAERPEDRTPLGALRSAPVTVVTSDGVPLHVEIDEVDPTQTRTGGGNEVTLVFVHGFCLNLDCWHFQRAAYRGLVRSVFYDQRSHGRSGRGPIGSATIEQLGDDLLQVLDAVVPEGPVILVGHSMGGMTIAAFAENNPELFAPRSEGGRIIGTALISTTAGGLDPSKLLIPVLPAKLSGGIANRTIKTLAKGHGMVDRVRAMGASVATVFTDVFAFGDAVPAAYVDFVDGILSQTPFEVVAEFFPSFRRLDKFATINALGRIPTTIICGTGDRLTGIGHSRKLHSYIPGSRLVECEKAGHMVILERHGQVNAELDQLLASATRDAASA